MTILELLKSLFTSEPLEKQVVQKDILQKAPPHIP